MSILVRLSYRNALCTTLLLLRLDRAQTWAVKLSPCPDWAVNVYQATSAVSPRICRAESHLQQPSLGWQEKVAKQQDMEGKYLDSKMLTKINSWTATYCIREALEKQMGLFGSFVQMLMMFTTGDCWKASAWWSHLSSSSSSAWTKPTSCKDHLSFLRKVSMAGKWRISVSGLPQGNQGYKRFARGTKQASGGRRRGGRGA